MGVVAKLCILLTVTIFAVEGAMIGIARLTYHDLFAPYMAIMPGQSIDALKDYPCKVYSPKTTTMQVGVCEFPSDLGPFGQITLTAFNHIITQTYMSVQPEKLYMGDLAVCWGEPIYGEADYPNSGLRIDMFWDNQMHALAHPTQDSTQAGYGLKIAYLLIEGVGLSPEQETSICTSS